MYGAIQYSSSKLPAQTQGLKPLASPYGAYPQLNPQPAAPTDPYAKVPSLKNGYAGLDPAIQTAINANQNSPTTSGQTPPKAPPSNIQAPSATGDLSGDPVLAKIKSYGLNNYLQAGAGADAAAKQAIIASGFGDVANSYQFGTPADDLLGAGDATHTGDPATVQAANQNPFSIAALLLAAHNQANVNVDQANNARNTYYGSARINDLADEAHNYTGKVAGAQSDLQSTLSGIVQNLIAARQAQEQAYLGEYENAYNRALQQALANGTRGPGSSSSSPGTTPPGQTPAWAGSNPFALPSSVVDPLYTLSRLQKGLAPVGGF